MFLIYIWQAMGRPGKTPFLVAALACATLSGGALLASPKSPAPEIYSATESDDGKPDPVIPRTPPRAHSHPKKHASKARRPLSYDPVPSGEEDAVAARLQIVDKLIREFGRAYDYRSHTLKELEGILAQLETRDAPPAPPKLHEPEVLSRDPE
jgi:hypothetical protein